MLLNMLKAADILGSKLWDLFSGKTSVHHLMSRLESVQYSAAFAVTGAWKGTSRDEIYQELGWETLTDRRWYRRLTLFYKKVINGLAPSMQHFIGMRCDTMTAFQL